MVETEKKTQKNQKKNQEKEKKKQKKTTEKTHNKIDGSSATPFNPEPGSLNGHLCTGWRHSPCQQRATQPVCCAHVAVGAVVETAETNDKHSSVKASNS